MKLFTTRKSIILVEILLGLIISFCGGYNIAENKYKENVIITDTIEYTLDTLSEWEIFQLATIKTESDFNYLARGNNNDLGIFQITPIYVKEVNRILKDTVYNHIDAFNIDFSLHMFNIVQNYYNPNHSITIAIDKHNPKGDCIDYAIKVYKNIEYIKRYEEVRNKIINYR